MPPFRPEAVVFDLDGVLVDSEGLWAEAEQAVIEGLGRPWDPSIRPALLGLGAREAAELLAAHVGGIDPDQMDGLIRAEITRRFTEGVPVTDGAMELVEQLAGRIPVGVATNSRRSLAMIALKSSGFADLVDAFVSADDVARPKPAPDPYLRACELLSARPERSVAIEDSPTGAASAKAAGMWVIGCPSLDGQMLSAADAIVGSLRQIDPVRLLTVAV